MSWETSVFALFEDLEMQAEGLHLQQRAIEVDALIESGYAEVLMASRVHASSGASLRLGLVEGTEVRGRLTRAGAGWLLLDAGSSEWLVQLSAIEVIDGLVATSLAPELWGVLTRLSVRSALRRISEVDGLCTVWLTGGRQLSGALGRVGADFFEIRSAHAELVVPTAAMAAVQGAR